MHGEVAGQIPLNQKANRHHAPWAKSQNLFIEKIVYTKKSIYGANDNCICGAQTIKHATNATTIDNPAPPLSLLDAPLKDSGWKGVGPVAVLGLVLSEGLPGKVLLLAA